MTGLMAGLFYAWSISVKPGIARLSDGEYLAAFQAMNRAILNPAFFLVFFGAALILPVSSYLLYKASAGLSFQLTVAATALYIICVFAVTAAGNVPLNNRLEAFRVEDASTDELRTFRASIEGRWNRLNLIRTICSLAALILLIIACAHSAPPG